MVGATETKASRVTHSVHDAMRPLRLGVLFDQHISAGGGYQQSINAALLMQQLPHQLVTPIFLTTLKHNVEPLKQCGIDAHYLDIPRWRVVLMRLRRLTRASRLYRLIRKFEGDNMLEKRLREYSIDLVYFLSPSELACYAENINYLTTVWDLSHRDDPEFPEVRDAFQFEAREALYSAILPKSTGVLVDSPLGRDNVVRRYAVDVERVHVMPFSPAIGSLMSDDRYQPTFIDIAEKYTLNCPYVFYPAQFWAHKNHVYLLLGLKRLEEEFGHKIGAIFSGGDMGNLTHIREQVDALGLADRVRFTGFVRNEEIPHLYKQALALVMPTYFGPTNLPPLEAFHIGVPVLYSDKPGMRDQVGDAALLMDLDEPLSMARHLTMLIKEPELRTRLIEAGKARLNTYGDQKRIESWVKILKNFRQRRMCWKD